MEDRIIPRQVIKAAISLADGRSVTGEIQIDLDLRLSDFLNLPSQFIIMKDNDGTIKLINKRHIVDLRVM